jgi:hypothetical protein
MATPAPYLAEEILKEILIRLPTLAALARASTACVSFRRIITSRSFLRRYRKSTHRRSWDSPPKTVASTPFRNPIPPCRWPVPSPTLLSIVDSVLSALPLATMTTMRRRSGCSAG